jgi:hydrogenase/urease accessory protein HupE
MRLALTLAIATALALVPGSARGHGMRTAYLELGEGAGDAVLAQWRQTFPDASVVPRFPTACSVADDGAAHSRRVHAFSLHCPGGLAGRTVGVDGLGPVLTEAVVRVVRRDGTVLSRVLTRDSPAWTVPAGESWMRVAADYVRLGVAHILTGYDHLLFLLALVLYVRRPRAVLIAETAFTLSHSASFSATALGLVRVSAPAAEACIALSLVLVALDVGRRPAEGSAVWQAPAIALVFGLVHGLGFAGALSEVGLPDHAVAAALVAFGLGVEVGQIAFLLVVMAALWVLERTRAAWIPRLALAGSYAVGVSGAFWLWQRLWEIVA